MRLEHMLDFTENHRFYILREFSLSPLDDKVLNAMYQPMIGTGACALYRLLFQQLPAERVGYSEPDQQRKLFLALGVEPGDKGRRVMADYASRLEAVGLMHTYRKTNPEQEETLYFYHLQPPLSPYEFFRNQHLVLLLRDHIGKHAVLHLHREFCAAEPEEWKDGLVRSQNVSMPFYDLFMLNTHVIDYELEQALAEMAPARNASEEDKPPQGYQYSEIIMQFPRLSRNRTYVEQISRKPEQLHAINYVAGKYRLTLQEVCRLLDEDGVFAADGELDLDMLQHLANLVYRQSKRRQEERERVLMRVKNPRLAGEEKPVDSQYWLEVPAVLKDQCDIRQYNMFLRNKPYLEILEIFFPGQIPDPILNVFERIDLQYKLAEEVINVLIHYLYVNNLPWTRPFVESVASDMLGRRIQTYEQAVQYIREQTETRKGTREPKTGGRSPKTAQQKPASRPKLPVYKGSKEPNVTDEEYEAILRKVREMEGK